MQKVISKSLLIWKKPSFFIKEIFYRKNIPSIKLISMRNLETILLCGNFNFMRIIKAQ